MPAWHTVRDVDVKALLDERQKTHGPYEEKAWTIQHLKKAMRASFGWSKLSPTQAESLDMIVHKIGRILTGDPNHPDHWEDIIGYAELAKRHLGKDQEP